MIAFLASLAFSWLGISAGALLAVGAAALVVYLRMPTSWLLTIAIAYGGWFGLGVVYQAGIDACEDRVRAAVAAEQTRQAGVRAKALDAAVGRELAAREANNEMQDKVEAYERELATQPADDAAPPPDGCPPKFLLRPSDVDGLRKLQQ